MPTVIPGFDGVYKIDEDGNVFNRYDRQMKTQTANNGYIRIELLYVKYLVHRLMALTFLPNPDNKPEVNHIDNDKTNNKLANLEWVTHAENQQRMKHYKTETGEHHISKAKRCYKRDTKNHKKGEQYGWAYQGGFMKDGKIHKFCAATLEEAIERRDALHKKLFDE